MTVTVGTYNSTTKSVPITFTFVGISYSRNMKAELNNDGSYNATATSIKANRTVSGLAFLSDITDLAASIPGGSLGSSVWTKLPSIYKIITNGTGIVTIDAKDRDGTIHSAVVVLNAAGSEKIEFPVFDNPVKYIRASCSGSATAELV